MACFVSFAHAENNIRWLSPCDNRALHHMTTVTFWFILDIEMTKFSFLVNCYPRHISLIMWYKFKTLHGLANTHKSILAFSFTGETNIHRLNVLQVQTLELILCCFCCCICTKKYIKNFNADGVKWRDKQNKSQVVLLLLVQRQH